METCVPNEFILETILYPHFATCPFTVPNPVSLPRGISTEIHPTIWHWWGLLRETKPPFRSRVDRNISVAIRTHRFLRNCSTGGACACSGSNFPDLLLAPRMFQLQIFLLGGVLRPVWAFWRSGRTFCQRNRGLPSFRHLTQPHLFRRRSA